MAKKKVEKKEEKKELKLTEAQFYKLSYLQTFINYDKLKMDNEQKERKIKMLLKKINELEIGLIEAKILAMDKLSKENVNKLDDYRKEIANDLGLASLENYLIDDETLVVKSMDELI